MWAEDRDDDAAPRRRGVRIEGRGLRVRRQSSTILDGVTLEVRGLVAIIGGSGAGKTTLLDALAGVRPADVGDVLADGVPVAAHAASWRRLVGYVPQDDIIHADLTLERTLRYAARLRLPPGTDVEGRVEEVLLAIDLEGRRQVKVAALSGGQRKRASIAVELLSRPAVFFLDEPTSGLDPATAAELLQLLRRLVDEEGATVVFTTHAVQDLAACDQTVVLAPGGRLAYAGPVADAPRHFGVSRIEQIYSRLAENDVESPQAEPACDPAETDGARMETAPPHPGAIRQWAVLTGRTFETLARNPLTMAILLGSPVMIVAMFAVLFRAGAFDRADPRPGAIVMIIFWVAFGTFFFGLTYGLLQICTERAVLRREHFVGVRLGPYLLSKVTVLLPFLLVVNVLMLVVLRALDRLPAVEAATYLSVGGTLGLQALAALALGLLTSAAVANPSQATLALPMLCFPAVLFSGAIVPVEAMAAAGVALSYVVPVRWAFEAIGHDLGVRGLLAEGGSPLGPPLLETYGDAGSLATGTYWLILAAFAVVFLAAGRMVLGRSMSSRRTSRTT